MVLSDQAFRVAIKILRGIGELLWGAAVNAGQSTDHTHIAASGFLKKFLRYDRPGTGKGLASGGTGGQEGIKKIAGALPSVSPVLIFHFLREDPGLQPTEKL